VSADATPAVEGWFTDGPEPALVGGRCAVCGSVFFPPSPGPCRDPACPSTELTPTPLSRRGRIWSYTDAQYQPPPPYLVQGDYRPFAIAAVELPEGITVLGQVADGYDVGDLSIGSEMELVVETLYNDESGPRTTWRWRPTEGAGR
jgi:uncharacterized OB-fold protein